MSYKNPYMLQYCPERKENVPVKNYIGKDGKEYFECLNRQYCISENNGCNNQFVNSVQDQTRLG